MSETRHPGSQGDMYAFTKPVGVIRGNPEGRTLEKGETPCHHNCLYCYQRSNCRPMFLKKYSGPLRVEERDLKQICGGNPKTYFIQNNGEDMFSERMPSALIKEVLARCVEKPDNTYLFQTRNPKRFRQFVSYYPKNSIFCITLETNWAWSWTKTASGDRAWQYFVFPAQGCHWQPVSEAPPPRERYEAMLDFSNNRIEHWWPETWKTMVTKEPLMDFDAYYFAMQLKDLNPDIIAIGADSKNWNLPEPPKEKVQSLIDFIRTKMPDTELVIKPNLIKRYGGFE